MTPSESPERGRRAPGRMCPPRPAPGGRGQTRGPRRQAEEFGLQCAQQTCRCPTELLPKPTPPSEPSPVSPQNEVSLVTCSHTSCFSV